MQFGKVQKMEELDTPALETGSTFRFTVLSSKLQNPELLFLNTSAFNRQFVSADLKNLTLTTLALTLVSAKLPNLQASEFRDWKSRWWVKQ